MKKRYVIIGLLAASLSVRGQQDSSYVKKRLKKTDVQVLLSYYTQDNDHSAVTGGIGTEDLQVYASQFSVNTQKDSVREFHLGLGLDVISSASTDNIDFEMSSASKTDTRTHADASLARTYGRTKAGITSAFSIESDYLSLGGGFFINKLSVDRSTEMSLSFQAFFDDLRWGRFDNGKPQELVYPEELRWKEWFSTYRRNSYNLALGMYRAINKKMAFGVYPGLSYQSGLLSTPFHRVYFTDDSERVENLPGDRIKIPVGMRLNVFAGRYTIVRLYYRFYWDNFGMDAHTLSVEAPVKITPILTLIPFARFYTQHAADYFKPYGRHETAQEFYTSDYDLSDFDSYKSGLGFRYAPFAKKNGRTFREIEVRYAFYKRSDGLTAGMISAFFDVAWEKWQDRKM